MTIRQILNQARTQDIEFGIARKLLCYVLNVNDTYVTINGEKELEEKYFIAYNEYITQLKNGKPLQYITQTQEFMGMEFYVDENVLIPQPDTEVLVEQTITVCKKQLKKSKLSELYTKQLESRLEPYLIKFKILDLCTGSGAIAISVKKEMKENVKIYASDISEKALEVAKKNARNLLEGQDITFIQSDMFENINEKFDIIVSNPPYIKTDIIKTLNKDVQNEPEIALDGGKDGLDFYREIRKNAPNYLKKGGYILLEIGYDQKDEVLNLFENAVCIKDYTGNDRVVIWKIDNQ